MGFLETLRGWAGIDPDVDDATSRGASANLDETDPQIASLFVETTAFDRDQWRKKLKRILEKLPTSEPQWNDLEIEAGALLFETAWIASTYRDEFTLMVRKMVSDRIVTPQEHRRINMARTLMGIPDPEAEAIFLATVRDAEQFFGAEVEGV